MSDRDLGGPMPEDLRDLLDAERELEAPKADTRERLLERLAPLLLLPPGGMPGPADPTGSATAGATKTIAHAGWRAKLLVPVLSAALGGVGGAATHAYVTRSSPNAPAPSLKLEAPPAQAPTPTAASAAPEQAIAPEVTPPAASFGPTPATSPPPPSSAGTLRGERLLLESATAALMRGDPTTALGTLQKHARQYPHGALSEEREVLWVKALRAQGNDAAAEKRAKDFKRQFPSSLQQGALDNRGGSR